MAKDTGPVIRAWYITDNLDPVATVAMRDQLHWELTQITKPEEYENAVDGLKRPEAKKPEVVLLGETTIAQNSLVTRLDSEGIHTFVPFNRNFLRNRELLYWIESEKSAGRIASVRVLHFGGEKYKAKPVGVFFNGSEATEAAFRNLAIEVRSPHLSPQARK